MEGSTIFWSSKHQALVNLSRYEFKYYILNKVGKEKV